MQFICSDWDCHLQQWSTLGVDPLVEYVPSAANLSDLPSPIPKWGAAWCAARYHRGGDSYPGRLAASGVARLARLARRGNVPSLARCYAWLRPFGKPGESHKTAPSLP